MALNVHRHGHVRTTSNLPLLEVRLKPYRFRLGKNNCIPPIFLRHGRALFVDRVGTSVASAGQCPGARPQETNDVSRYYFLIAGAIGMRNGMTPEKKKNTSMSYGFLYSGTPRFIPTRPLLLAPASLFRVKFVWHPAKGLRETAAERQEDESSAGGEDQAALGSGILGVGRDGSGRGVSGSGDRYRSRRVRCDLVCL